MGFVSHLVLFLPSSDGVASWDASTRRWLREDQMDSKRFDEVTKSFAGNTSRRTILKRLAGGSLAAVFGLRAAEASAGA